LTGPPGRNGLSRLRFLCGHVYRQLHELYDGSPGHGPAGERNHSRRQRQTDPPGQGGGHADYGNGLKQDLTPSKILTEKAFRNALRWIWPWAAPPIRSYTCRPSPGRRESDWTSRPLMPSALHTAAVQTEPRRFPPHRGPGQGGGYSCCHGGTPAGRTSWTDRL
jgi:hypothetical protein